MCLFGVPLFCILKLWCKFSPQAPSWAPRLLCEDVMIPGPLSLERCRGAQEARLRGPLQCVPLHSGPSLSLFSSHAPMPVAWDPDQSWGAGPSLARPTQRMGRISELCHLHSSGGCHSRGPRRGAPSPGLNRFSTQSSGPGSGQVLSQHKGRGETAWR